jgi:hypothetical protein
MFQKKYSLILTIIFFLAGGILGLGGFRSVYLYLW